MSIKEKIARGATGVLGTILGAGVSLSAVEIWLRILSLCVGIAVGLVTIWSLVRPWLKERRARRPWEQD